MILNIILIAAAVFVGLFILSLVIYFFNLDMKMAAMMTPLMHKIYNHVKRDTKL